jgi:hypothetical protein
MTADRNSIGSIAAFVCPEKLSLTAMVEGVAKVRSGILVGLLSDHCVSQILSTA